jgi:hypothetical protein
MANFSSTEIEEILKALDVIKTKLPNGELEVIKKSIQSLSEDQKSIKEDLEYFKKRLFNPDDGVIVRINKNTDAILRNEEFIEEIPQIKNRVDYLEKWQNGVNKALWIIFTSIAGIIIAMLFALLTKK